MPRWIKVDKGIIAQRNLIFMKATETEAILNIGLRTEKAQCVNNETREEMEKYFSEKIFNHKVQWIFIRLVVVSYCNFSSSEQQSPTFTK